MCSESNFHHRYTLPYPSLTHSDPVDGLVVLGFASSFSLVQPTFVGSNGTSGSFRSSKPFRQSLRRSNSIDSLLRDRVLVGREPEGLCRSVPTRLCRYPKCQVFEPGYQLIRRVLISLYFVEDCVRCDNIDALVRVFTTVTRI